MLVLCLCRVLYWVTIVVCVYKCWNKFSLWNYQQNLINKTNFLCFWQ